MLGSLITLHAHCVQTDRSFVAGTTYNELSRNMMLLSSNHTSLDTTTTISAITTSVTIITIHVNVTINITTQTCTLSLRSTLLDNWTHLECTLSFRFQKDQRNLCIPSLANCCVKNVILLEISSRRNLQGIPGCQPGIELQSLCLHSIVSSRRSV